MIQLQNISYAYENEIVLDNITLSIEKNTTCAIIGASGCGKTTLIYLLTGILKNQCGTIVIDKEELTKIRPTTAVILQSYGLLPFKTVYENVSLGLKVKKKFTKNEIQQKTLEVLSELNIIELKNKFPTQLSGGQKQRVAIARSIVLSPDLLLMDEPSSALDTMTKENIQNLILQIHQRRNITIVFVTHNIEEAVFLGQKIVVMKKRKIHTILENANCGSNDYRNQPAFYEKCSEVRKCLSEIT